MPRTLASGKICCIEIPATDVRRSAECYAMVFGWRTRQARRRRDRLRRPCGRGERHVGPRLAADGEPGLLICITVDSVAATCEAVRQRRRDRAARSVRTRRR